MKCFLMTYHRPSGAVDIVETFEEQRYAEAISRRLDLEDSLASQPDVEIVILGATSEADLHRTHARYFTTLADLLHGASEAS